MLKVVILVWSWRSHMTVSKVLFDITMMPPQRLEKNSCSQSDIALMSVKLNEIK